MAVKNRLKEILTERGIKQSWLVDHLNLTKGTVSNIINNKYPTSLDIAFKIAKLLNMQLIDIFYEDLED